MSQRGHCSMIHFVDQYQSIITLSNTSKPFMFHSIFIQNIYFHQHIPSFTDALFPEQSGIHILSPKSLYFLNLQSPNPLNSYFQSLNLSISRHHIRSDAAYPFTTALLPISAQLLPLYFVKGLDPPKSARTRPALFRFDNRSLCGRADGGGIGDARCHQKSEVFPGGESKGVLWADW